MCETDSPEYFNLNPVHAPEYFNLNPVHAPNPLRILIQRWSTLSHQKIKRWSNLVALQNLLFYLKQLPQERSSRVPRLVYLRLKVLMEILREVGLALYSMVVIALYAFKSVAKFFRLPD